MINLKETKKIKEALAVEPTRYQPIIDNSELAICITNRDGKFVAVNDNYLELYGYQREELIGKDFTLVVPPSQREALQKYHERFFIDKYEILRTWEVMNKRGEIMEITADAGYHKNIEGTACKVTLIKLEKILKHSVRNDGQAANSPA